jgi:hypothetical protein
MDKPGDCPKCGMKLSPQKTAGPTYTCPMHPEVRSDKPGDCPKCGMKLQPVKGAPAGAGEQKKPEGQTTPAVGVPPSPAAGRKRAGSGALPHYCPMCEGVASERPGKCPRCGMDLVLRPGTTASGGAR